MVALSRSALRSQARAGRAPQALDLPARPGRPLRAVAVVLGGAGALLVAGLVAPPGGGPLASPPAGAAAPAGTPASGAPGAITGGAAQAPTTGGPTRGASVPPRVTVTARAAARACTAPCSTAQVVSVTIVPGPLTVSAAPRSVAVTVGADGTGVARLEGLRVIDLRGQSPGWALSTRVESVVDDAGVAVPGATVSFAAACTRTAGPLTLVSSPPEEVQVGESADLCVVPVASAGSLAGGLVSAYADVTVRGAAPGSTVDVLLDTTVG